ncbi:MAG: C45 family autoproteolytic acyltransferase/hydrolase [Phycisphaerales bacterium]
MPRLLLSASLLTLILIAGGGTGCNSRMFKGCEDTSALQAATVDHRDGWLILKLSGTPYQIGHAHGLALAAEIDDCIRENIAASEQGSDSDPATTWAWMRKACKEVIEPKIPDEYRQEMQGITDALHERGFNYDYTDVAAYNAYIELGYWHGAEAKLQQKKTAFKAPERCSAFIATGSQTADGKIVAAHNTWSSFVDGQRFNVILDITPEKGHRFVMDTQPGYIHSATDWFINDAGIILTETTIGDFEGFDPAGTPEFTRARQAAQYAESIDAVYQTLQRSNNGGYANAWLIGDIKTSEIAKLELGLKNVIFHRTTQGAYVGSNFPENDKLIAEECPDYKDDPNDGTIIRKARWKAVLTENAGKVDAETAKRFMGDTTDARTGKLGATDCTLCGRSDLTPDKDGERSPGGASNAKVTTAAMAKDLRFWARMGIPDGSTFNAKAFLDSHDGKKYQWQRPFLRDMPSEPWMVYEAK